MRSGTHRVFDNGVRAVVFDIGDTLIPATRIAAKALEHAAHHLKSKSIIPNVNRFCSAYRTIDAKVQGVDVNHLYSGIQILRPISEELGLKKQHLFYYHFLTSYRHHVRNSISHNISTRKVFAEIIRRRIKIGILSDGTTYEQIEQLKLLGILESVDEIVTSQEVNVEKPNRLAFESILSKLKTKPQNTFMVGDDLIRDIKGGQDAGMITVRLTKYLPSNSSTKDIKADYQIPILKAFVPIIDSHGK